MLAIIDYQMGNVGSLQNALNLLGAKALITNKSKDIKRSTHIFLPGVGAFGEGIKKLKDLGLIKILEEEVFGQKKPFLGICLGMQLLGEEGQEDGPNPGLGWIKGKTKFLNISDKIYRLPHIGWNDVQIKKSSPIFDSITSPTFYFVHSYFLLPEENELVTATCTYGKRFPVAIQKNNIFGVQFHPEKSQKDGLKLLKNFLSLT